MRLGEIVLEKASSIPDRAAVIFRDHSITYGQLSARIQQFAAGLLDLGLSQGDRIALLLPNCPAFLIGYYAATLIDIVVVPANPLLKPAELRYIWSDSAIRMVVTIPQLLPIVQAARVDLPELKHVVCAAPADERGPDDPSKSIDGFITMDDLLVDGATALATNPAIILSQPSEDDA